MPYVNSRCSAGELDIPSLSVALCTGGMSHAEWAYAALLDCLFLSNRLAASENSAFPRRVRLLHPRIWKNWHCPLLASMVVVSTAATFVLPVFLGALATGFSVAVCPTQKTQ